MFNLFNKYKTENKNKKPIFKTISPKKYSLYISNFMNNSKNQVFVEGFIQGDYIKKNDNIYILSKNNKIFKSSILSIKSKDNEIIEKAKDEFVTINLYNIDIKNLNEGDILTNINPENNIDDDIQNLNSLRLKTLILEYEKENDLFVKNLLYEELALNAKLASLVVYLNKEDLSDISLPTFKIKEALTNEIINLYPAFTEYNNAIFWKGYVKTQDIIPMSLEDYLYLITLINSDIDGIIINPDIDNFIVSKKDLIDIFQITKNN